jgi:hypothetical protein
MVTSLLPGDVFRETALVRGQARLSTFATRANLRFHTNTPRRKQRSETKGVNCLLPSVVKELNQDRNS